MSPDAHEPDAVTVVHRLQRRYVALGLIVVAIVLLAALVFIRHDTNNSDNQPTTAETFSPAPTSLIQSLAQVPAAASNAVGVSSPTVAPTATRNPSLWTASTRQAGSVPVIFFYGAEFAPYAAAERWPLVVALSRFGTFTQLGLMQSSGSDAFSDTNTFTFSHVAYSSPVVDLQADERYSTLIPTGARYVSLQKPSRRQAASVATYDTSDTTFPLIDIANRYVLVGSSFSPSVLADLNQSQIATDLAVPENPVAQAVLTAANEITAAICTVTGQQPDKVCHARGVVAADQKMHIRR